ncbi:MAG: PadR family transcriptional regulator [Emergencia sp.]
MSKKTTGKRSILDNFEAQFKKSTLPLMVLKILSEREMYAYEIVQETLHRSEGKYKMPLLYTTLSKLQEQGFVEECGKVISEDNRVRVYYRVTEDGRYHLKKLMNLYAELTETVKAIVYDDK